MIAVLLALALGGATPAFHPVPPPRPTQAQLDMWKRHLETTLSDTATTDEQIFAFQRLAWEGAWEMIPEIERLRAEVATLRKRCAR